MKTIPQPIVEAAILSLLLLPTCLLALASLFVMFHVVPASAQEAPSLSETERKELLSQATELDRQVDTFHDQGKYAQATPLAREVLALREKALGAEHPDVATSLNILAELLRAQGSDAGAKPLYERALKIREKAFGTKHPAVAQILNNLGSLLYSQGDYAAAKPLFERAIEIWENTLGSKDQHVAAGINNLALLLQAQGNYVAAKPLFERALVIWQTAFGSEHQTVANCLNNQALLLEDQGDYAAARPLMERALKIAEKAFGSGHPRMAIFLDNLAALMQAQGDYAAAKPLFERALGITEQTLGHEHPRVGNCLNNLGALHEAQGDYARAKPLYERALKIKEKAFGPEHPSVAVSLNNLAVTLHKQGDYAGAKPLYEQSLKISRKALGAEHPDVAASLASLAWLLHQQGEKDQALQYMAEACRALEMQRLRVAGGGRERARFMETYGRPFPTEVVWLSENGDLIQGLNCAERGRARSLLETLAESRARVDEALPDALRQRREALTWRLNVLEKQRREAFDKHRPLEPILEEIKAIETQWDQLAEQIRRANPRFASLEYPQPMGGKQLVQSGLLDAKTVLVSFTTTGKQSVALVLDHKGDVHSAFVAAENKENVVKITAILGAIESSAITRETGKQLFETYKAWFEPIEPWLQGKQRLIVLADGSLHLLPLEILLTEEPKSDNPAEWAWLVKKYEIHYGPSGTVLAQLREESGKRRAERRNWPHELLAVADPPFSQKQLAEMQKEGTPLLAQATRSSGLEVARGAEALFRFDATNTPQRLPGTRAEALSLGRLFGDKQASLLIGPDATKRRIWELSKSGELAKYRYIHFATHGWVDTERPELSGLVLSLVDKSEEYDGLLQMREIFALKLDADLVVLSACQTGRGKLMRGEGVVGLAQAFFYAGTPSLVVSLWNVNDASTALLMKRFYSNLKSGMPKAAALREAKLWLMTLSENDLKNEDKALARTDVTRGLGQPVKSAPGDIAHPYSHPRHWAPFVLIGDSE